MSNLRHWQSVYQHKDHTKVSWYQPSASTSLDLIKQYAAGKETRIIDAGAGASVLVDALLDESFSHLTCMDISAEALAISRNRLDQQATRIEWITADVLCAAFEQCFDMWHDRAVFHFLTDPVDQQQYAARAAEALANNGIAIIATFAKGGPTSCSGLPVSQHDATSIVDVFGGRFDLIDTLTEAHMTPFETLQTFSYFVLHKKR